MQFLKQESVLIFIDINEYKMLSASTFARA